MVEKHTDNVAIKFMGRKDGDSETRRVDFSSLRPSRSCQAFSSGVMGNLQRKKYVVRVKDRVHIYISITHTEVRSRLVSRLTWLCLSVCPYVKSVFIYPHRSFCPVAGSQWGTGTQSQWVGPCRHGSSPRCWSYTHSALGDIEHKPVVKCSRS